MEKRPKYYFIKYKSKGKTFFKDQNGKKVARAKVEKSKKKVYELVQRTTIAEKQGDLRDRKKVRAQVRKAVKKTAARVFRILNVMINGEIAFAIESGYTIYTIWQGQKLNHYSTQSKMNLVLFQTELNAVFYEIMKPVIESPYYFIGHQFSDSQSYSLFNYDMMDFKEDKLLQRKTIIKAWLLFKSLAKSVWNKYFN